MIVYSSEYGLKGASEIISLLAKFQEEQEEVEEKVKQPRSPEWIEFNRKLMVLTGLKVSTAEDGRTVITVEISISSIKSLGESYPQIYEEVAKKFSL